MEKKLGRPLGLLKGKNRNIRLTDEQWKTFREKLGIEWLREQIEIAENAPPLTKE